MIFMKFYKVRPHVLRVAIFKLTFWIRRINRRKYIESVFIVMSYTTNLEAYGHTKKMKRWFYMVNLIKVAVSSLQASVFTVRSQIF